jgi:hypothetical protein
VEIWKEIMYFMKLLLRKIVNSCWSGQAGDTEDARRGCLDFSQKEAENLGNALTFRTP